MIKKTCVLWLILFAITLLIMASCANDGGLVYDEAVSTENYLTYDKSCVLGSSLDYGGIYSTEDNKNICELDRFLFADIFYIGDENKRIELINENIENFAFLREYEVDTLFIYRGHINSFDFFDEIIGLRALIIVSTEINDAVLSIPYVKSLRNIEIHHRNALQLIRDNSHIEGHLDMHLVYSHNEHAETVHVSLKPLKEFVNIRAFTYRGYTTSLDLYYLQNARNLIFIDIWRDVYSLQNLEYLTLLEKLEYMRLPVQELGNAIDSGMFGDVVIEMGS